MRSAEGMSVEKAANQSRQRRIQNVFWTLGLGGHRFMMASLESTGAQVAEGRMPALTVVEQLDVFEHRAAGLGGCGPTSLVGQFKFARGEEAFRHRVVPAVATAAHAAQDSMSGQQLLIFVAGVLAAAVRVVQQSARRWFALITGQAIRRGSFDRVARLERAIMRWLEHCNENARPFHWTKSAATIKRSLQSATAIYETRH